MNGPRLAIASLVAGLVALAGCSGSPTPAGSPLASAPAAGGPVTSPSGSPSASHEQQSVPAGRILFHRLGSQEFERYFAIDTAGTRETALYEAHGCGCAHLSADGSHVLTIGATGHGTWSLMTLDLDGGDKRVVDPPIETLNLFVGATSANGRVLAFFGMDETDPDNTGLWIASPDLSDATLVMPLAEDMLAVEPFGVTPDGTKIVFFAETGPEGRTTHAGDLFVVNADGSGLRQLNPAGPKPGYMGMPVISLSPDGRQAAFGVADAVWVVDLDGGNARPITPRTGFVWAVSWSPTGEWITYTRFHGRTPTVAIVRPDGTDDHQISADEANAAVWSPDGQYLLVPRESDSGIDRQTDLWILDPDGTWISQVTDEPSNYGTYVWAPAPARER